YCNFHILANLSKNFFANISIFPQKFLNKFTQNLKISLHKLLRNKSNYFSSCVAVVSSFMFVV
ncbi:MAG: hypothetical protein ABIC82_06645, partial [bacterium]